MIYKLSKNQILQLLEKQINNYFDCNFDFSPYIDDVFKSLDTCFSKIKNKYYNNQNSTIFDSYHSCQYMVFLYTLSNQLHKNNVDSAICSQVYYLNKIMHSIDLFYEIEMPDHWFCDHPLGTVLGRAKYGDYFSFIQGCTVGQNHGIYPSFDEYVAMHAHSSVIGNSHIGRYTIIGANTNIKDEDIPDCSLVFGNSPNLVIIKKTEEEQKKFFSQLWKEF